MCTLVPIRLQLINGTQHSGNVDLLGDMNVTVDYVMTDGASTNRSFATMLSPQTPQNSNWIFRDIYFREHGICFNQDVMHVLKKFAIIWKPVRYRTRQVLVAIWFRMANVSHGTIGKHVTVSIFKVASPFIGN